MLGVSNTGLDGIEVIVIRSSGSDLKSTSGDNSNFGQGGYEVIVDSKINGDTYFVELRSAGGTVLSPQIQVTFPSNCDQNVALLYWEQQRPF